MFVFSPSLSIFTKCSYIFVLLVPLLLLFLGLFLVSEFSPGYTILTRFLRLFLYMWRIGMTNYFRFICIWIFSFTCSFLLSGSFPLRGSHMAALKRDTCFSSPVILLLSVWTVVLLAVVWECLHLNSLAEYRVHLT